MAIGVLVAVATFFSSAAMDARSDSGEVGRARKTVPKGIDGRRTDNFGRVVIPDLTLHVNVVARIRMAEILVEQWRQRVEVITHIDIKELPKNTAV